MKINYRLFNNEGIFEECVCFQVREKERINFCFNNVPEGAVAHFYSSQGSIYRNIKDGCCEVENELLEGVISVSVLLLNNDKKSWSCESIYVSHLAGVAMISSANLDLAGKISELKKCYHNLKKEIAELFEKYKKLDEEFDKSLRGHDVI